MSCVARDRACRPGRRRHSEEGEEGRSGGSSTGATNGRLMVAHGWKATASLKDGSPLICG